jgi:hypothetical protein
MVFWQWQSQWEVLVVEFEEWAHNGGIKDQMFEELNTYFALELKICNVVAIDVGHLCAN